MKHFESPWPSGPSAGPARPPEPMKINEFDGSWPPGASAGPVRPPERMKINDFEGPWSPGAWAWGHLWELSLLQVAPTCIRNSYVLEIFC